MDAPSEIEAQGKFEARYLAFLETITHLRPRLHRYCSRMTGSVFDGEDVVQDALFQAYRKLDTLADDRPLAPWLFRIAHNRCIDVLRRGGVREHAEAAAEAPESVLPVDPPGPALGRAVEHLVLTLPPKERACVLTTSGYQVAREGQNGFVCVVLRGWAAPTYTPAEIRALVYDPTVRAPICFNPGAARAVLPYYELRSKLGMAGNTPDQIAGGVETAYSMGELPERDGVSFAYMWSADQQLGPGVGHWHPHMMVFAPYHDNTMLGGNAFGSPLPFVTDDAGTPFAVIVIPVDDRLAIKAQQQ